MPNGAVKLRKLETDSVSAPWTTCKCWIWIIVYCRTNSCKEERSGIYLGHVVNVSSLFKKKTLQESNSLLHVWRTWGQRNRLIHARPKYRSTVCPAAAAAASKSPSGCRGTETSPSGQAPVLLGLSCSRSWSWAWVRGRGHADISAVC